MPQQTSQGRVGVRQLWDKQHANWEKGEPPKVVQELWGKEGVGRSECTAVSRSSTAVADAPAAAASAAAAAATAADAAAAPPELDHAKSAAPTEGRHWPAPKSTLRWGSTSKCPPYQAASAQHSVGVGQRVRRRWKCCSNGIWRTGPIADTAYTSQRRWASESGRALIPTSAWPRPAGPAVTRGPSGKVKSFGTGTSTGLRCPRAPESEEGPDLRNIRDQVQPQLLPAGDSPIPERQQRLGQSNGQKVTRGAISQSSASPARSGSREGNENLQRCEPPTARTAFHGSPRFSRAATPSPGKSRRRSEQQPSR